MIDQKRAAYYKPEKFNEMFKEFDEDENGFLSK